MGSGYEICREGAEVARSRGTWGTVREVPKKGSGRFQASYMHGGVRGVTKGERYTAPAIFGTRGDAWSWLDREHRLIIRDEWTPPAERMRQAEEERSQAAQERHFMATSPTISEYGRRYLDRDDLAPSSRDRYRQLFEFYIEARPATLTRRGTTKGKPVAKIGLGGVRVINISRGHLRDWWHGLPLSSRESSCRQAYDLLRAIMNSAVEDELIEVNPVKVKAASRAQASRERDIDPLPVAVLYAVADRMPEAWRLGVLLGGVLGLRSGEVRALQRRDFNLSGDLKTVKVERAVKEAVGVLELGPVKTARRGIASRTLPIPPALVDDIKSHLRQHTQLGRNGLLFWRTRDGGPIRSADWLKVFKKACSAVAADLEEAALAEYDRSGRPESEESQRARELLTGRGGYVVHGTRVTGLTWAYRLSGGNLRAVQAMGGHTSPKMALRYQRAELDYLAEVADNVSGMIDRSRAQPSS